MDNSREQYCQAIAIWMLAIRSIAVAFSEWPVSMRLHLRKHLEQIQAANRLVAANELPNHVQCMSAQRIDIRSIPNGKG